MAIDSTKRVIHRFIRELSAYEFGGELYSQIIPLDTQAYAIYPNEEGNRFFYVIGDGEHTYTEIRDGKGNGEAYKEYPVFTKNNINTIISGIEQEEAERKAADELLQLQIDNEKLSREQIDKYLQQQIDNHANNKENPHQVTKDQIGLGNVDNVADLNKPISTATQNALDEISTLLSDEETRATSKENELESAITSEVLRATQAEESLSDIKLDKISDVNKVYGTDSQGNQIGYNIDSFGKVDDIKINNISIVSDKIANLGTMAKENSLDYYTSLQIDSKNYQTENQVETKISDKLKDYTTTSELQISYVAKESGKGLSTNDYSDTDKDKVDSLGTMSTESAADYSTKIVADTLYANKSIEQALSTETTNRENADTNLQSQIDAITVSSDVTDIVGSYADLESYDTTSLAPNNIVKVLQDENRNNKTTYYRWVVEENIGHWFLIGEEGPYYTKSEADSKFVFQERTINGKTLSSNITLSASDVGADSSGSAAIAEQNAKDYTDSLASNYATAAQGQLADTAVQPDDLAIVATSGNYNDLSNLPEIPSAQIQSDWNQTDDRALDYIKNKPYIPSELIVDQTYNSDSTHAQSGTAVAQAISGKQDVLISGTNIKTINGQSILGSGNIVFDTAPTQGSTNAITSGAVYEVLGNLETALYNFNSRTK